MFLTDLFEKIQSPRLYHGTYPHHAAAMLFDNKILARTEHEVYTNSKIKYKEKHLNKNDWNEHSKLKGVSLSRSFNFAVDWNSGEGVVIELDRNLLIQNKKLINVDYYQNRREAEEFCIGDIAPLSKYLTAIYITPKIQKWCDNYDKEMIEGHKEYEELLNHPLLIVKNYTHKFMSVGA